MADPRETSTAPHWMLVTTPHSEWIEDVKHNSRLFSLATTGFGTTSDSLRLAKRVVDFLNSLPPEETLLYPRIWKP